MLKSVRGYQQVFRDFLWIIAGVFIGQFYLSIQTMPIHRVVVIVGGMGVFALLLSTRDRFKILLFFYFLTAVYNPDKYFAIINKCSWTDGIYISAFDIIWIAMLFLYAAQHSKQALNKEHFLRHLDFPMLMLLLASVLSLHDSINKGASAFQIIIFAKLYLVYFLINRILYLRNIRAALFTGMALIVFVQFLFACLQFARRGGGLGDFRPYGTLDNPNSLAELIAPISVMLVAIYFTSTKRIYKLIAPIFILMAYLVLLLSYSRGGWISALAAHLILFLFLIREKIFKVRHILAVGIVALAFMAVFHEQILQRLQFGDESALSRVYLNRAAFQMIKEHPLWGVGINTSSFLIKRYYYSGLQTKDWLHTVHNQYLLIWSEMGTVGIISFLWMLLGTFFYGWKAFRNPDSEDRFLALGLILVLFTSALHMLVDMYVAFPNLVFLWTIFAATAAVYTKKQKPKLEQAIIQERYSLLSDSKGSYRIKPN